MAKRFSKIAILLMLVLALLVPMMVMSVGAEETSATLVTDASTLAAGDKVVIVAPSKNVAMSTTQNGNNRGQASVTISGNTVTFGSDVQVFTLEAGTTSGTFAFNTGAGYIYAASSSSNYLRTETTKSANSSWSISIDADGIATVKAQGSNTKNWLRYNSSSSLFSCYSSGQGDISIYKLVSSGSGSEPTCEHLNQTTATVEATCTTAGSITVTCDDCHEVVSTEEIAALGHNYVDGKCTNADCDSELFKPTFVVLGEVKEFDITLAETIELPTVTDVVEGYEFAGWVTSEYSSETTGVAFKAPGEKVNLTSEVTYYALFSREIITSGVEVWKKATDSANLGVGKEIIIVSEAKGVVAGAILNDYLSQTTVTIADGKITDLPSGALVLTLGNGENGWTMSNGGNNLSATAVKTLSFAGNGNGEWTISFDSDGNATIQNLTETYGRFLHNVNSTRFTTYTSSTNSAMLLPQIYLKSSDTASVTYYTTSPVVEEACEHVNVTTVTVDPTCTEAGSTTVTCDDCHEIVSFISTDALGHAWGEGVITTPASCTNDGVKTYTCTNDDCTETKTEPIAKLGHNYVNGICVKCFSKESITGNATLTFDTTDNRVSWDANSQVWYANGITVTNVKTDGSSDIVDSSNPVKFYKHSVVTVECSDMAVITFNCNTAAYATALQNSIASSEEYTVTADGKTVTVTFVATTNSFEVTLSGGQVRVDSIEVTSTLKDKIVGASLYIGKDLSMLYNVTTAGDIADYTMKFTFNGEEIVVNATQFGDNYFFVLDAIAPNLMGEDIKAELYCGDECVAVKDAYSVLEYCEYFLKGEGSANCSAELKELLANLLEYGAAAQIYTDTNTENLVNKDVDGAVNYECTENVKDVSGSMAVIAGAGASFGVDNKLYFRLDEGYKSLGEVTAKINGEDAEIVGGYVYTEGVKATELSKVFTLVLYVDGTEVQTATYSITSYITIIGANDTAGAALANALYNYGCSAKNYVGE